MMDDLRQALFRALRKSDVNMLRAVLARGVSLEVHDGDRYPVCLEAINANRNDLDILEMLVAAGADPHARWAQDGATALHWVVSRERPDVLNWFLAHRADVNAAALDGTTPLMSAVIAADGPDQPDAQSAALRDIRVLLAAGADVRRADAEGGTALHSAAARGLTGIAGLLLDHGAEVDARDANGETPLLRAAAAGQGDVVGLLLRRGADPAAQGACRFSALHDMAGLDPDGMTPQRLTIAETLIRAGCSPDLRDQDGRTALCWAASSNNTAMAKLLLDHGADADALDGFALREAVFFEYDGLVDALLAAGAGPGLKHKDTDGDWGNVPLTIAAHENYVHGLTALLDRGAPIDAQTTDGETALMIAVRRGNIEAASLLLKRGADRGHADRYGNTPLGWATRRGNVAMIDLLK